MFSLTEMFAKKTAMPNAEKALKGRNIPVLADGVTHYVSGKPLHGPFAEHLEQVQFGMGCFWGAERIFWNLEGVELTAVGYSGGFTPHPTYPETCTGQTGHTETVLVVYDPEVISFEALLKLFWEAHDPTQGMRQGNDVGTTYRSAIYCESEAQLQAARASKQVYEASLKQAGEGVITTEIMAWQEFYYAEAEHQQYLAKNPSGYCSMRGTGVSCAI